MPESLSSPAGPTARSTGSQSPAGASPAPRRSAADARRLERWDRIGLGIRLAYNPARADAVRVWLAIGRQLARDGVLDEAVMLARTLSLLLRTAEDPVVPTGWRHVCLDHAARPLARVRTLVRDGGMCAASALHALGVRVEAAVASRTLPGAAA